MGNFNDHLKAGVVSYVLLIPITIGVAIVYDKIPLATAFISLGVGPIVVIGALFPDIDHHASRPHKVFKKYTSLLFALCSIILVYLNLDTIQTIMTDFIDSNLSFYIGAGTIVLSILTFIGTSKMITILRPKHRGVTHRFFTGLGFSLVLSALVYAVCSVRFGNTPLVFSSSIMTGVGFMFGFFSHLYVDGILFRLKTYTTIR